MDDGAGGGVVADFSACARADATSRRGAMARSRSLLEPAAVDLEAIFAMAGALLLVAMHGEYL